MLLLCGNTRFWICKKATLDCCNSIRAPEISECCNVYWTPSKDFFHLISRWFYFGQSFCLYSDTCWCVALCAEASIALSIGHANNHKEKPMKSARKKSSSKRKSPKAQSEELQPAQRQKLSPGIVISRMSESPLTLQRSQSGSEVTYAHGPTEPGSCTAAKSSIHIDKNLNSDAACIKPSVQKTTEAKAQNNVEDFKYAEEPKSRPGAQEGQVEELQHSKMDMRLKSYKSPNKGLSAKTQRIGSPDGDGHHQQGKLHKVQPGFNVAHSKEKGMADSNQFKHSASEKKMPQAKFRLQNHQMSSTVPRRKSRLGPTKVVCCHMGDIQGWP